MRIGLCLLSLIAVCAETVAQTEIHIDSDLAVLRPGESTTVTLRAGFPPDEFAMAAVGTSLISSVGSEGWSDLELIIPMDGVGTSAGSLSATGVDQILAGQLNFSPTGGADISNPIPFWRATYTAPSAVGSPFEVQLSTETTLYEVYFDLFSAETRSYLDELVEGSGTLRVVPAPAPLALLWFGTLAMSRRRR